jgi:uncharacterized protein YsxB (DUF464 family)
MSQSNSKVLTCDCKLSTEFSAVQQRRHETIENLTESLQDCEAVIQVSKTILTAIRENLEGNNDPKKNLKCVSLTYYMERIIESYEEKTLQAIYGRLDD